MSGLSGKRVLVIGSSSGIGAAVAKRFAERGANLVVHCHANRAGAEALRDNIRNAGGAAHLVQGDASEPAGAAGLVDEAIALLGGLDILINNAGTMFGRTSIADAEDHQYHDVINLNIGSVFFASRRGAQLFREQRAGTIINTTSIAARNGGSDGAGLYGSAKAFVSTITRVMAKEMAPFGVRVNAVAPGVIATPFHDRYSSQQQLAAAAQNIPMGRLGTAEDCVGAYEFLADDAMSGYITGQTIEVNGGQLMP